MEFETYRGAVYSPCRKYRYALWEIWKDTAKLVTFIGLNPASADEFENDKTVRRCWGFAKDWGYDGFFMANAFAYRTPKPKEMFAQKDPVGEHNDKYIQAMCMASEIVIACWSAMAYQRPWSRIIRVLKHIPDWSKIRILALTKGGYPMHPLYLEKSLLPSKWHLSDTKENQDSSVVRWR